MATLKNYEPALNGTVAADLGGKGTTGSPAYLKLSALDGTAYYIYVEADGTLKVHTAIPTVDTDGSVVGSQS